MYGYSHMIDQPGGAMTHTSKEGSNIRGTSNIFDDDVAEIDRWSVDTSKLIVYRDEQSWRRFVAPLPKHKVKSVYCTHFANSKGFSLWDKLSVKFYHLVTDTICRPSFTVLF